MHPKVSRSFLLHIPVMEELQRITRELGESQVLFVERAIFAHIKTRYASFLSLEKRQEIAKLLKLPEGSEK